MNVKWTLYESYMNVLWMLYDHHVPVRYTCMFWIFISLSHGSLGFGYVCGWPESRHQSNKSFAPIVGPLQRRRENRANRFQDVPGQKSRNRSFQASHSWFVLAIINYHHWFPWWYWMLSQIIIPPWRSFGSNPTLGSMELANSFLWLPSFPGSFINLAQVIE